jgi:hypothetical protein
MAIFANLKTENIIQVDDKVRLDATQSFVSPNEAAISLVEINPDGSGFIDVTTNMYLDWQYNEANEYEASVRVTTDGDPTTKTITITVISNDDDKLFSDDSLLISHEPDILKWLMDGKSSFNNIHRRSQELILAWLDEKGYVDVYGNKYTKEAIVDIDEVKQWSTFMTLRLIFESLSNAIDDIFSQKAKKYQILEFQARSRAVLRIDIDGDGIVDTGEQLSISSGVVLRR